MRIAPAHLAKAITTGYHLWSRLLRHRVLFMEPVLELKAQGALFAFALWHEEMFNMAKIRHGFDLVGLVSPSRDGEIVAECLKNLGVATARGSSSRGGVRGLINTCRIMRKESRHAVITVDGPRGPRRKAKDGVFFLAQKAPALIVPVRAYMTRKKVFAKAWDRFQLPLPGSKVILAFGEPYSVQEEALNPDVLAAERIKLEQNMAAVDRKVSALLSPLERLDFDLAPIFQEEMYEDALGAGAESGAGRQARRPASEELPARQRSLWRNP